MRRGCLLLVAVGLLVALNGCRTPFEPPTIPLANLYPTLHPGSILDSSKSLRLTEVEVAAVLSQLGLLEPLRAHGLGTVEVPLVSRGLERHGYAELDARRSACPVHWVVLRGVAEAGGTWLVVEAGMESTPGCASACGIDLVAAPVSVRPRTDVYGRRSQVETWRGGVGASPVEVRRVLPSGRPAYWELEYRQAMPRLAAGT